MFRSEDDACWAGGGRWSWWVAVVVYCCLHATAWAQISPGPLSKAHESLEGSLRCTSCHQLAVGAPQFRCTTCHTEIVSKVKAKAGYHGKVVKLADGAKSECVRCHVEHFGKDFNIVKWPSTKEKFDHTITGYVLSGKHATAKCEQCHSSAHIQASAKASIKSTHSFFGLSQQCVSCHRDVHEGRLGAECTRCHTGFESWKTTGGGFDHSATRFALTGRHAQVACNQCHKDNGATGAAKFTGLAFGSCKDCHNDPHRGAFVDACSRCHNTASWKPNAETTSSFDHSKTAFPLKGLHAKVECGQCHKSANFKEAVAHTQCADCHREDPHRGQFKGKDCGLCHHEVGFKPSIYTVTLHQNTGFPLLGKHASTDCAKCHIPKGKETVFLVKHERCLDCHRDSHGGQFVSKPYDNKCELCHDEHGFQPSTFSLAKHQQTRFALSGAHAAVPCAECHKVPVNDAKAVVPFHFAQSRCVDCHVDPHVNPVTKAVLKQDCTACHVTRSWKETTKFDHDQTAFRLLGAHRAVACIDCHKPAARGDGVVSKVIFAGAPQQCSGCHEDIHGGQFSKRGGPVDCTACHTVAAWKPANFDHDKQTPFSLAGAHRAVACNACHVFQETRGVRMVRVYSHVGVTCADCHSSMKNKQLAVKLQR